VGIENPVHLLFIAVVALIVLGPKRLPALARALGQGIREFRASLEDGSEGATEQEPSAQHASSAEQAAGQSRPPGEAG
jgi:TatA/E family protein of Tat protein translocase